VAPEGGPEDIFLHANDLLVPEEMIRPGVVVEFEVEEGGRGPKASHVRFPQGSAKAVIAARSAQSGAAMVDDDDAWDALTLDGFTAQITEVLLTVVPPLGGDQILDARRRMIAAAQQQGWIAS